MTGDPYHSFATRVAGRYRNAFGDFARAQTLFDAAYLKRPDPAITLDEPVSKDEALWADMTVTACGLGRIFDAAFAALLNKPLVGKGTFADRVEQIYMDKEPRSWEVYDAAYSQLRMMHLTLTQDVNQSS